MKGDKGVRVRHSMQHDCNTTAYIHTNTLCNSFTLEPYCSALYYSVLLCTTLYHTVLPMMRTSES